MPTRQQFEAARDIAKRTATDADWLRQKVKRFGLALTANEVAGFLSLFDSTQGCLANVEPHLRSPNGRVRLDEMVASSAHRLAREFGQLVFLAIVTPVREALAANGIFDDWPTPPTSAGDVEPQISANSEAIAASLASPSARFANITHVDVRELCLMIDHEFESAVRDAGDTTGGHTEKNGNRYGYQTSTRMPP